MDEKTAKQRRKVQAVTLPPEIQERVIQIANERRWSLAQTGGYLIELALEVLDGQPKQRAA